MFSLQLLRTFQCVQNHEVRCLSWLCTIRSARMTSIFKNKTFFFSSRFIHNNISWKPIPSEQIWLLIGTDREPLFFLFLNVIKWHYNQRTYWRVYKNSISGRSSPVRDHNYYEIRFSRLSQKRLPQKSSLKKQSKFEFPKKEGLSIFLNLGKEGKLLTTRTCQCPSDLHPNGVVGISH